MAMAVAVAATTGSALMTETPACSTARQARRSSAVASFRSGSGFCGDVLRQKLCGSAGRQERMPVRALVKQVDVSKVVPQGERVLVRLEEVAEKSAGGVLLPKSAAKFERYLVGQVLAVGSEVSAIEKGQKVVFSDLNAYEVNLGSSDKLCFCKATDLLAVVE